MKVAHYASSYIATDKAKGLYRNYRYADYLFAGLDTPEAVALLEALETNKSQNITYHYNTLKIDYLVISKHDFLLGLIKLEKRGLIECQWNIVDQYTHVDAWRRNFDIEPQIYKAHLDNLERIPF